MAEVKAQSKIVIGSKVKLKNSFGHGDWKDHSGQIGTIDRIGAGRDYPFGITWRDGKHSSAPGNNLELIIEDWDV